MKTYEKLLEKAEKEEEKKTEYDNVEHPKHYLECSLECFDIMRMMFGNEAVMHFCVCNAYKYLHRHKNKNGWEDLQKAKWYLDKAVLLSEDNDAIRFYEMWRILEQCEREWKEVYGEEDE